MRNKFLCLYASALLAVSCCAAAEPLRHRAQAERAWVLDEGGVILEEPGKPSRAVALAGWQWISERYACAPDMAVGPRGQIVVTSNALPTLWEIDPETLAVSVHPLQLDADNDKDFGFSGLVYSERDGAYFAVSDLGGSLWRIDPQLGRAQKIALPVRGACVLDQFALIGGTR
jgi:hypothetical protein